MAVAIMNTLNVIGVGLPLPMHAARLRGLAGALLKKKRFNHRRSAGCVGALALQSAR